MIAYIIDNQKLQLDNITADQENIINQEFSVLAPKAAYIDTGDGGFDGWYRKYNKFTKTMSRAFLGELIRVCSENGIPLDIIDNRPAWNYGVPDPDSIGSDFLPGITLDDHQIKSIKAACSGPVYLNEVGCFDIPTGGGKGEIIAGLTKLFACPTVVICDQTVVIQQLKDRLELRKVAEEVGMFFSGKRPNGQNVIVGTIQSLSCPTIPPSRTKKDTDETYDRKMAAHNTGLKMLMVFESLSKGVNY